CARVVEKGERRRAGERLRDEGPLLHPTGERPKGRVRFSLEADTRDRRRDAVAIVVTQRAEHAARCEPSGGHDLADRRRSIAAELGTLGEVPEGSAVREAMCGLAIEERGAPGRPLEAEHDTYQRRLAAPVRPCAGDGLPLRLLA